jgi:hypothetical protein
MADEVKFKGAMVPTILINYMDRERAAVVPPLTWSQMLRKILTERYAAKKAVKK